VHRRMEVFLETENTIFVDDFAHHPTAIRETIAAARLRWPDRRIRAVFEPRSNTTVTNRFQGAMEEAFSAADEVFIGPVHRADAIPESQRLDTAVLTKALMEKGIPARAFKDVGTLAETLIATGGNRDVVLIMSNGAFGGIYDLFRKQAPSGQALPAS